MNRANGRNRIKVENSSLQNYDPGTLKFDLIVSNPPFFTDSLKNPDTGKAAARHNDTLKNEDLLKGVNRLLADRRQVSGNYALC